MMFMTDAPSTRRVLNRTWTDLHPHDGANRVAWRDHLHAAATAAGLTEPQLSMAVGYQPGWARSFWSQTSWRLSTMQVMARAVGFRMEVYIETAGVKLAREAPEWDALRALFPPGTRRGDEVERQWLADAGHRLRVAMGVGRAELGHVLSMSSTRVRDWEDGDAADYLFLTAQRFFRGLGRALYPLLVDDRGRLIAPVGLMRLGAQDRSEGVDAVRVAEGDPVRVWNSAQSDTFVEFPAEVWQTWLRRQRLNIK